MTTYTVVRRELFAVDPTIEPVAKADSFNEALIELVSYANAQELSLLPVIAHEVAALSSVKPQQAWTTVRNGTAELVELLAITKEV